MPMSVLMAAHNQMCHLQNYSAREGYWATKNGFSYKYVTSTSFSYLRIAQDFTSFLCTGCMRVASQKHNCSNLLDSKQ